MRKLNIAVVGATGVVGSMFLQILKEKKIKINNLYLYASEKSENKIIKFKNKEYSVIKLCKENILDKNIDYALFSACFCILFKNSSTSSKLKTSCKLWSGTSCSTFSKPSFTFPPTFCVSESFDKNSHQQKIME